MNKLRTILTWGLLLAASHVMGYTITVSPTQIEAGQSTNLIINLNNTETNLTAYQMKIFLPTGVTVQKKANGKYAYTSNADRLDPDLFTITVKDAADGSVLIAVFSPDKDVIAGTSGELIRLPIDVASTVTTSLQGSLKEIEFTDINNQAYNISDVNFTLTMQGSGTPDPGVVTGDVTVSIPDVAITAGSSTNLIINMQTGLTNLTAYQMKLYLPTGVTVQKKANGKYAYTSNADRLDPDLFTITVKDAADGSVLIAVFSPDKDVIAGTSGELIRLPIDVASTVTTSLQGSLKEIEFTDVNNQAYNISDVNFTMTMGGETSPNITFADPAVKALCVANWDTNHDGELSEAEAAAVTDLGEVFRGNTTITYFNELQYFTGLTSIHDNAFEGCTNLTSIILPNGLITIGGCAFRSTAITSLTIPASVTYIAVSADSGGLTEDCTSLMNIYVEEDNSHYYSENGVLFSEDEDIIGANGKAILLFPQGRSGSYIIPSGVTVIAQRAFVSCKGLNSIVIPEGVTTIAGEYAFHGCSNLSRITIPSSMTNIGDGSFYNCSSISDVYCYAENVPNTNSNAFENSSISTATLHVPAASLEAYSTTAPWSGFGTIVPIEEAGIEVTDISQLDNVVYIEPMEARAGNAKTLSVKMKNSVPMESFGFDLVLPEGITVATDEDGFPLAELSTERTTARKTDVFSAILKSDGSLNVQAYSNNKYTISGNDGEVALITINISSTLEAGDYPIILKNIAMGDASATSYRVESVTSKLTVPSYILGDANGDGYVDVADHTAISHWILEQPDASFNFKAADANCDGYVDVADHTAVSHIIIDSAALPTNAAPRPKKLEQIIEPE